MIRRIWPDPAALDDAALRSSYAPDRDRPCLRVNFVTSLDGAVEVDGYSRGLSSDADRGVFALLRTLADAVMVGAGTLRHEGYGAIRLADEVVAWRRQRGMAEHPTLVIVSSGLEMNADHKAFVGAPVRPVVLTHEGAPTERRRAIDAVADVVTCGESLVDLAAGIAELRGRGLDQVLCEGGPHLFGALLAADLVDELCLTVSPLLVGAGPDRIVAGTRRADPVPLRLVHILESEGTLLTRYSRAR